jgi:hypothetical protein
LLKGQVAVLVAPLKTSSALATFLGIYNILLRVQTSVQLLSTLVILFLPLAYMLGVENPMVMTIAFN